MLFIIVLITLISGCTTVPVNPNPSPTATPTPVPTPTQTPLPPQVVSDAGLEKPTPGVTPSLQSTLTINLAPGEATERFLYAGSAIAPAVSQLPTGIHVTLYSMPTITTVTPSFTGARVGAYYDELVPLVGSVSGPFFMDVSVDTGTAVAAYPIMVGDLPITVKVWNVSLPELPTYPLYVGLFTGPVMAAFNIPASASNSQIIPTFAQFIAILRANRVEPIEQMLAAPSQAMSNGLLNIDQWTDGSSFRSTEVTGALAPACLVNPSDIGSGWATATTLAAWNKTLPGDWVYLTDEPGTGANPDANLAGTLARAQLVRTNAPLVQTMVTHEPTSNLLGLVDHFVVPFEYFMQPGHWTNYAAAPGYWLYGACMSHGSCSNGTQGTPDGTPDLMIEQSVTHAFAFASMPAALGGAASLYYDSVYGFANGAGYAQIGTANATTNQYYFGGNGDGTLLYPGSTGPLPSIRLKMLRQGLFYAEYMKLAAPSTVKALVPDQFSWSRSASDWEALRSSVGVPL